MSATVDQQLQKKRLCKMKDVVLDEAGEVVRWCSYSYSTAVPYLRLQAF